MEYSNMMGKILEYINSLTSPQETKLQQRLIDELITKINSSWLTAFWLVLLHLSMLTFDRGMILVLDSLIFIAIFAVKLFIYCRFMDS
jgi:hypothetical protein